MSSPAADSCCRGLGAISWFPVHCTSINNTNSLISGDNKGVASQASRARRPSPITQGSSSALAFLCLGKCSCADDSASQR